MKYRKRPVVIDAFLCKDLIRAASTSWKDLPECIARAYDVGGIVFCPHYITIKTLEGNMRADESDMVILGVKGELYPRKMDIFEATYEKAE